MATTYAIPDGRVAMAATLYTGTQAARTIDNSVNGVGFQPDLVWSKSRSNGESHRFNDSVRGGNGTVLYTLFPNETSAEDTNTAVSGFVSNGFTMVAGSLSPNVTGRTYVGWQWKAGGTAVSNTAGSITSSVSANPTAGFSVVTYTGTGSNATVGHGLGVAPSMVIARRRNGVSNWVCWHSAFAGTQQILLNDTGAVSTDATAWNSTVPSSTVISVGNNGYTNASTGLQVAYCFAPVAGYSAFGKYTGNGSADGPFVFTNFRPRYVMIKRTDTAGYHWGIWDTSVNTYNLEQLSLYADSSSAEINATDLAFDGLSNGFKLRGTSLGVNASGGTYIYYAVAENPFKFSNAR